MCDSPFKTPLVRAHVNKSLTLPDDWYLVEVRAWVLANFSASMKIGRCTTRLLLLPKSSLHCSTENIPRPGMLTAWGSVSLVEDL